MTTTAGEDVELMKRFRRLGNQRNWFLIQESSSSDEFKMPSKSHLLAVTAKTAATATVTKENVKPNQDSPIGGEFIPPPSSIVKKSNRFVIDSDDEEEKEKEQEEEEEAEDDDADITDLIQKTQSKLIIHSDSDSSDSESDESESVSNLSAPLDHPDDVHNINIAALTRSTYDRINASVFRSALPSSMRIEWCGRLLTTAGTTLCSRKQDLNGEWQRLASIKLSAKVVDSKYRLERTLAHEMCHAAAWLIDGQCKPPHGAVFQRWAARVTAVHADWQIKTCHTYQIRFAYQWQCVLCEKIIGRHSAKSIDIERHQCGTCGGRLEELL
jgi:predicted SprT family Zn-dependent metalloprotease